MTMPATALRQGPGHWHASTGLTLVELLVSMTLGLLLALAALGSLLVARQNHAPADAVVQLRDKGRFLQTSIERLVAQAGYKNLRSSSTPNDLCAALSTESPPPSPPTIFGLNNAMRISTGSWCTGTARSANDVGYGSDILVLRYQASVATNDSLATDKTMIDCAGFTSAIEENPDEDLESILHVGTGPDEEPSLMCTRLKSRSPLEYETYPLISGVENFQVLYGVGIPPHNPNRYWRADEIGSYKNWYRVRSIRIGIVLRGAPGSDDTGVESILYPLGITKGSPTGAIGTAFSTDSDPKTIFVTPPDGRLRQAMTFTVYLRNASGE